MAIALLRTPVNPFDLKTVLLAKHAQHEDGEQFRPTQCVLGRN